MKKTSLMRILYAYLITQIIVLCISASAVGVVIAGDRTDYIQNGKEVSVQIERSLPDVQTMTAEKLMKNDIKRKLCSLPAPVGSTISIIVQIKKIAEEYCF